MEEKLSIPDSPTTDGHSRLGIFGRRRSLPFARTGFFTRNPSRSTVAEDTLCTAVSDLSTIQSSDHFIINEGLSSSFTIIGHGEVDPELTFADDMLVIPSKPPKPSLDTYLHHPKDSKHVISLLQQGYDPNQRDLSHDSLAPIHAIIKSKLPNRSECLEALLVYGDISINLSAAHNMTALHFAAMVGDMRCVKLLLSFGADINAVSDFEQTPMNIAVAHDREDIIKLLEALRGITAAFVEPAVFHPIPVITSPSCFKQRIFLSPESSDGELEVPTRPTSRQLGRFDNEVVPMESARICNIVPPAQTQAHSMFTFNEEDLVSMANNCQPFLHTPQLMHTLSYKMHNGHRILCLDGGWMRSLIQIDILEQLEFFTGQSITEMFDVLIGSSSGALIILAMVYGGCSLAQLRQLFFRMKDAIFSNSPHELSYNSSVLRDFIRSAVGRDMKLCDIKTPKVMVSAVNKASTDLELNFFTNFAGDSFAHEYVFKVATCATATPSLFNEVNHFVDGSVLANNPCDFALSYLQWHYHHHLREQFPISLVVSVGAGLYNPEKFRGLQPPSPTKSKETREIVQRIHNMTLILKQSILQSDEVANRCAERCNQLGTTFFRFNPQLKEVVSIAETSTRKLINMTLRSRIEMHNRRGGTEALKQYFLKITELYNACGGGLEPYNSDATSPDGMFILRASSDTTTSSDEVKTQRIT